MNATRPERQSIDRARPRGGRLLAACGVVLVHSAVALTAPPQQTQAGTPPKPATAAKEEPSARSGDDLLIPPVRPGSPVRRVSGLSAAGPLRAPFEVVDAGREDTGDLATSIRRLPLDLRLPTGFDRVYRVPGRDDLYMRANGALYAVFPKSEYRATRSGERPVTPTDVVYRIGLAPEGPLVPPPAPNAARIDRRIDARIAAAPTPATEPMGSGARGDRGTDPSPPAPTTRDTDPAARSRAATDPDPLLNPWAHLALGPARVNRE
jgi:hypothetical protein